MSLYDHLEVQEQGSYAVVTLNRAEQRNALSFDVLAELLDAVWGVGETEATGMILAANGPAFCAGHDFTDMVERDLGEMRKLLGLCSEVMVALQSIPQPTVARVHAVATAAGCQLVASCDLAVASLEASFAIPGGRGGWFCHTPLVAVARSLPPKRALEMAFSGDAIDAETAAEWGFINEAVPAEELDMATTALLDRCTRGSAFSKGLGKSGYYAQIGMEQSKAYEYAVELMASTSQTADAAEGMASFIEKRAPYFRNR